MKTLFFCGHKSPYGLAHLEPLLKSNFRIIGVVLATDSRWKIFKEKISGKKYYNYSRSKQRFKIILKRSFRWSVISKLKSQNIGKILKLLFLYSSKTFLNAFIRKHKVPFWYVEDVNSKEFIQKVKMLQPDLIISAAYPQIFSKELIEIPSRGAVNCHPSLLPKFRGAHPHFWVIAKGEKESGLTAHFMTERLDDGDIIAQIRFPIDNYNYEELYMKIIQETPNLIRQIEEFFLEGKGKPRKQDDSLATFFRNDREIHHRIFWTLHSADEIYNLVRTGKAFCFFRTKKINIIKCYTSETNRNLTNNVKVEEGTIVDLYKDSIVVKSKDGCVNIQEVIYCGKIMTFQKFAKKFKIEIGEKFE